MAKKNNKESFVEKCAALGFLIGSVTWFCIYFPKDGLDFGKFVIYIIVGTLIGGMIGELIKYSRKK